MTACEEFVPLKEMCVGCDNDVVNEMGYIRNHLHSFSIFLFYLVSHDIANGDVKECLQGVIGGVHRTFPVYGIDKAGENQFVSILARFFVVLSFFRGKCLRACLSWSVVVDLISCFRKLIFSFELVVSRSFLFLFAVAMIRRKRKLEGSL